MKPIIIGIIAAFFFAFTFVLNATMEAGGGSWIWSASLRYIFMVPFLLFIVLSRKNLLPLLQEMNRNKRAWALWSFVGFGLFYAPLCFAAAYSPGWLIAGTWQITIIAGTLLAPLFLITIHNNKEPVQLRGKIPIRGLMISFIILAGVSLMQLEHVSTVSSATLWFGFIPVLIAAFAYPLGNRKMMDLCEGRLDAYQRVLGMTLASLPFWLLLSLYGFLTVGGPTASQSFQTLIVAISSGVIATVLFFKATDLVRGNMQKLGAVEATQSMEVLFALAGEMLFLTIAWPSGLSLIGLLLVMLGMMLHSYVSGKTKKSVMQLNA
ncbi:multidrug resistance efflux transporter family protein [Planococcus sp. CPCC 101016]|uniref:DMT family transporter n=1 Tax=Planococcus sp. CPCC 101016 TaxID=2599617 RepID=UPI0011B68219|nr:multidrug resistance efflux transporter family protein [Planococcus sp. CPCC 101016]TWT08514.1 multidrug resistance efflux transporter family protein [Planococcus sp. CPCC 101016]